MALYSAKHATIHQLPTELISIILEYVVDEPVLDVFSTTPQKLQDRLREIQTAI